MTWNLTKAGPLRPKQLHPSTNVTGNLGELLVETWTPRSTTHPEPSTTRLHLWLVHPILIKPVYVSKTVSCFALTPWDVFSAKLWSSSFCWFSSMPEPQDLDEGFALLFNITNLVLSHSKDLWCVNRSLLISSNCFLHFCFCTLSSSSGQFVIMITLGGVDYPPT